MIKKHILFELFIIVNFFFIIFVFQGAHPWYIELRNGTTHGVFMKNSNGMDILIRDNTHTNINTGMLQYRMLGGIIDLYIVTGGSPEDTVKQYTQIIGTPHMPPFWGNTKIYTIQILFQCIYFIFYVLLFNFYFFQVLVITNVDLVLKIYHKLKMLLQILQNIIYHSMLCGQILII
jgi:hypothetical protein